MAWIKAKLCYVQLLGGNLGLWNWVHVQWRGSGLQGLFSLTVVKNVVTKTACEPNHGCFYCPLSSFY